MPDQDSPGRDCGRIIAGWMAFTRARCRVATIREIPHRSLTCMTPNDTLTTHDISTLKGFKCRIIIVSDI